MIRLFNASKKVFEYGETVFKKGFFYETQQLSSIKAQLYKQFPLSLPLLLNEETIVIELYEQLDFAKILFNTGLYLQSLNILERANELPQRYLRLERKFYHKQMEIVVQEKIFAKGRQGLTLMPSIVIFFASVFKLVIAFLLR